MTRYTLTIALLIGLTLVAGAVVTLIVAAAALLVLAITH